MTRFCIILINRSHKSNELIWNDPVKISVLNFLQIFIFFKFRSKRPEVIPAEFYCFLQAFEAVKKGALIGTVALACISVRYEQVVIWLEFVPHWLGRVSFNENHEKPHQECSIGHLCFLTSTLVIDFAVTVFGVSQKLTELFRESVGFGKVERAKVLVEWVVREISVDVEKERICYVSWSSLAWHPE